MKKKRFSVEQIAGILKQAALGAPIAELCRQHGISEQSYYRWKKLYGGMEPSEARELKELREENIKLKRLVADLSLDKVMLQDVLQKSSEAVKKREIVNYLMGRYGVGNRQACRCVRLHRSMYCVFHAKPATRFTSCRPLISRDAGQSFHACRPPLFGVRLR